MTANFVVNVTRYGYGEGPRLRARHEIWMAHTPQILEGRVGRHERMKGVTGLVAVLPSPRQSKSVYM